MPALRLTIPFLVLILSVLASRLPAVGPAVQPLVQAVEAVGITVSDMDRAVDFYSRVLFFERVSDVEVGGEALERLQGVPQPRCGSSACGWAASGSSSRST